MPGPSPAAGAAHSFHHHTKRYANQSPLQTGGAKYLTWPVSMSRCAALAGQRPSTAKTPVSVPTQEFWAAHRIPCCRYWKLRPSESGTGEFQSTRTNPTAPPGGAGGAEPPVLSAGSIGERRKHCCTLDKPFYSLYYNTADKNFHTDLTKIICLSANM